MVHEMMKIIQKPSALYLSDLELEKLAEQVYKRLGYVVQHVGQTGDHGDRRFAHQSK